MKHVLAPVALLAARATIPKPEAGDSAQGCANGVYLISIRGTGEQPGIGVAGSIIGSEVKKQIKSTKVVALKYPATLTSPSYMDSVADGISNLTQLISKHVAACPDDKIVLMGYSQGAQVALSTLCGSDEPGFTETKAIAPGIIEKHVVAVALFGDPTHVANATYNRGTSIRNGIFHRDNADSCSKYANMIASWCDTGDIYCDSGNETAVHGQYFANYDTTIVNFIVDKAEGKSSGSTTSTSASPTGTTAPIGSVQSSVSTTSASATKSNAALNKAESLKIASKGLYVALPLALAAMFQLL